MTMEDISQLLPSAQSAPTEAVDYIEGAKVFDISPSVYKDYKSDLSPEVDKIKNPTEATRNVASYAAQSDEHMSLVKPDLSKLSFLERQAVLFDDMIKNRSTQQKIIDLNLKKLYSPEKFDINDDVALEVENENIQKQALTSPNVSFTEGLPAEITGFGIDTLATLKKHAGAIAAATATGAGVGATAFGAGAIPGAATGLTLGFTGAMTVDGFNSQAALMYNELSQMKSPEAKPLNLDDQYKRNLSFGFSAVASAIGLGTGFGVAKATPFLSKFLSAKAASKIVSDPIYATVTQAIANIGKSIAAGGTGGAGIETAKILSEELAKAKGTGNEADFLNALQIGSERIAVSAGTLAAVAGTVTTATNIAGIKQTAKGFKTKIQAAEEQRFQQARDITPTPPKQIGDITPSVFGGANENVPMNPSPTEKAVQALQFDSVLSHMTEIPKDTEIGKLSKGELQSLRQAMFAQTHGRNVYLDKEDLNKWATDEKKAAAVRQLLDASGETAATINAPIRMDAHKFLELVDQYPDISELAKVSPEYPNASQATKFIADIQAADQKRSELLAKLGAPDLTAEQKVKLEESLKEVQPSHDVFNEQDYLKQPTFTKAIENIIPQTEVDKFNEAQMRARQSVVDNINDAAKYEMDRVKDIVVEQALETQVDIETQKLAEDPSINVVRNFNQIKDLKIDSSTLPENLKGYESHPQLKKHGVFGKGGMTADQAAIMVGVPNGEQLLKIMSQTPTEQEIVDRGVNLARAEIETLVNANVPLNETALLKAYSDNTKNHIAEMKFMKDKEWSATKSGIKRIALPLPRIEELSLQAKNIVGQFLVGQLNANQFKVGERKSQRIAVDSILKNEVEKAFVNKQAAALNSELTKETYKAIGQVNRVIRIARQFNKAGIKQELKDAGKLYEKAANEILDLFKLNPSKKGEAERGSFIKWVEKMIEQGEGNFEIPDKFNDLRRSINEMTVDQAIVIGDRLKTILHQARKKNELLAKFGPEAQAAQGLADLVSMLHEVSIAHPDYNPNKALVPQGKLPIIYKFGQALDDISSTLKNLEHILLNADNGKVGGLYNESIIGPLKGIGKYAGQGEQGKIVDRVALVKQFKTIIENFGKKEWPKMGYRKITIPEFANNRLLNNGELTEAQLFMMLLNDGNEGNTKRLADNFGVNISTIRTVLNRELQPKHMVAAQAIWDQFKSYYPRVVKLHEDMAGTTPEMVEPVPVTFQGKVYDGGYFPIMTASEMSLDKIRKRSDRDLQTATGDGEHFHGDTFYVEDMTRHGHTEKRTNNTSPLSLSMNVIGMGFDTVIHDLNFRRPIANAMKIVTDPQVANDLGSTIGIADYNVVVNSIADAGISQSMENNALFDSAKFFEVAEARIRSGVSVGYLVGNISSLMIQPTSLILASERMGLSGQKHLGLVAGRMLSQPHLISKMYVEASEMNPAIKENLEGLDENIRDSLTNMLPKAHINSSTAALATMQEFVNSTGFKALGEVDQLQKVIVTIAAYSQFTAGDVKGYPLEMISKMTPTELDHQAKIYASSIARLTLTSGSRLDRAPLQKHPFFRNSVMFWNDGRNVLNTVFRQARETRQSINKRNFGDAARITITSLAALATMQLLNDLIKGKPTPFTETEYDPDKEKSVATQKPFNQLMDEFPSYLATSSVDHVVSNIPFVRDVQFALTKAQNAQKIAVETLPSQVGTNIAVTLNTAISFMDFYNDERELTKKEKKSIAFTTSYVFGGLPIKMLFDSYHTLDSIDASAPSIIQPLGQIFLERFEKFKKEELDLHPEIMKFLESLRTQVDTANLDSSPIPTGTMELIKQIESKGVWNAKAPTSEAFGLYQFTPKTWADVVKQAPKALKLTIYGRVAKNPEQQERAMEFLTEQNIGILKKAEIPVTQENIYAAHFLGAGTAVTVLQATNDTKIKKLLSKEVMAANPQLNSSWKVKDFKNWVANKIAIAELELETKDKLTKR